MDASKRLDWDKLPPSANQPLILVVAANPEPHDVLTFLYSEDAMMNANPSRPKSTDLLEVQRRMGGVLLEKLKVFVCQLPYLGR